MQFQQVASSAIIYVSANANIDKLLPILEQDLKNIPAVLIRVNKLPMNARVEIELFGDSSLVKEEKVNWKVLIEQKFEKTEKQNHYGELFYIHGSEKVKKNHTSCIPCLEIVPIGGENHGKP